MGSRGCRTSISHLLQLEEELSVIVGPCPRQPCVTFGFLIVEAAMVVLFHAFLGLSRLLCALAQDVFAVVDNVKYGHASLLLT